MQIDCPNCQCQVEVGENDPAEIQCANCGSTFRLDQERTRTLATEQRTLGKFQMLERVGAGAFGVVWKARDTELNRFVALKIPHAGHITNQQEADRFLREGRSAARLRHPGIVSVYDVGRVDELPYLACEFVDGLTLGDVLTARRPAFRESAQLIAEIAEALDYAHSMGVVHRDIKPSNIMLEQAALDNDDTSDSQGVSLGKPLLTDFGLALLDEGEVTVTLDGQVLGTPAYMSPEQAAGRGHQVDARSDVYSLGVVIYQLLAGELPFRGNHRMLLQQVLREEPRPPRRLNDKIPRDLQTVALKCLAKEPDKRYPTAAALAADLRRWLAGEPVEARPVGMVERWWRWSKRNRGLASLSAAVLLLLIAVAAGSTVAAVRIAAARDEADRNAEAAVRIAEQERQARSLADRALAAEHEQRELAESNLARALDAEQQAQQAEAEAQQVAQFMAGLFRGSDPISFGGYEFGAPSRSGDLLTAREMLNRGAKKVVEELNDQPLVQANLIDTIGNVYATLGDLQSGIPMLERALEMRRAAYKEPHPDLADSLHNVGFMRFLQGRYAESEKLFREAIAMRAELLGADAPDTLLSKFMFAMVLLETDITSEIEQLLRDVVAGRDEQLKENDRDVAFAYTGLALVFAHQGETDKAFEAVEQAIAVLESPEGSDPVVEVFMLGVQGMLQAQSGDTQGAAAQFRQAIEQAYQIVGKGHPAVTFLQVELANFLEDSGDSAAAEAILRDAMARALEIYGRQPRAAEAMVDVASLARNDGRFDEAQDLYQQALEIERTVLGSDDPYVAYFSARFGTLRFAQGNLQDARELFETSLRILESQMGDDSYQLILPLCGLGAVDSAQGRQADGAERFERARRIAAGHLADGKVVRRLQFDTEELASLGAMLAESGQHAAAEQVLRQTIAIWQISLAADDWRLANANCGLGAALAGLKQYDDAETLLVAAHQVFDARFGNDDHRTQAAVSRLLNLYDAWERPEKAEEYRKQLSVSDAAHNANES